MLTSAFLRCSPGDATSIQKARTSCSCCLSRWNARRKFLYQVRRRHHMVGVETLS
ncbi:hypothetical protein K505DRAFT_136034 [Melanomma pulvis-pyrius CBS 109.77]|uniref:Uncharacterized protein n=1 Tax=Melanomma pulvis-pyrius CBS 109.77 TaxID=1314802 RepID=A0A6A6WSP9_9PLEO|nr:hypothetical protein K505DRAFT_136034 [Melanomma pulvis-pyrius CBS 109.77]